MKDLYKKVLKGCFSRYILRTRDSLQLTQEQMSELLSLSDRSYIDLEHEKSAPSGLSFALYLAYYCDDPNAFAVELREAFDKAAQKIS